MKSFIKYIGLLLLGSFLLPLPASAHKPTEMLLIQLHQQASQLPLSALRSGLKAYQYASTHHLLQQHLLAIADMALSSKQKRLWIFDMDKKKLLFHTLVAHGKNSGGLYADHFL